MHAVIVNVSITPARAEEARKALREEVIPRVRSAPGFVKGYWTADHDNQRGASMILFNTKEDAETAMNMVRNAPPPPGVTINDVELREVIAEA